MTKINRFEELVGEVDHLQRKYVLFISRGEAVPAEMEPVSKDEFLQEYYDYVLGCVSIALRKAKLAMDYIDAVDKHPDYIFEMYEGTVSPAPVATAENYAGEQIYWVDNTLKSSFLRSLVRNEDMKEDFHDVMDTLSPIKKAYKQKMNAYFQNFENLFNPEVTPRPSEKIEPEAAEKAILAVLEEFQESDYDQMAGRVKIINMLMDIYLTQEAYPDVYKAAAFLFEDEDILSYIKASLINLHGQHTTISAQVMEIVHDEDEQAIFPVPQWRPLDRNI